MQRLISLYKSLEGSEPANVVPLSASGSNRRYFRLYPQNESEYPLIGVIGTSPEENQTFFNLALMFAARHLPVPAVYVISDDRMCYLQEDLGDYSLYDFLKSGRENNGDYDDMQKMMVYLVMTELPRLQMEMASSYVYSQCYPFESMDRNSVMFDLNYFKYCYLKLTGTEFNELTLQKDFDCLADHLLDVKEMGFQYRDFQPRNIMLKEGKPFYIDFQGGRCGPVYYDLASFLWQASSKFSDQFRKEMVDVYIKHLKYFMEVDEVEFKMNLKKFVLFRTLQVLGAYGFRGLWEKKQHFIDSIPLALRNLNTLIEDGTCDAYPYLKDIACILVANQSRTDEETASPQNAEVMSLIQNDSTYLKKSEKPLVVRVYSFSFKKGIPADESGNGGGYVFDCRSTHNPGRYEQYKQINGLQQPVIDFLEQDGEILSFLDSVCKLADFHVQRFIARGFTNLMFSFGCTGGQHRSVYSAQHLAEHINQKFGIEVRICHREQNITQVLSAKKRNVNF